MCSYATTPYFQISACNEKKALNFPPPSPLSEGVGEHERCYFQSSAHFQTPTESGKQAGRRLYICPQQTDWPRYLCGTISDLLVDTVLPQRGNMKDLCG